MFNYWNVPFSLTKTVFKRFLSQCLTILCCAQKKNKKVLDEIWLLAEIRFFTECTGESVPLCVHWTGESVPLCVVCTVQGSVYNYVYCTGERVPLCVLYRGACTTMCTEQGSKYHYMTCAVQGSLYHCPPPVTTCTCTASWPTTTCTTLSETPGVRSYSQPGTSSIESQGGNFTKL